IQARGRRHALQLHPQPPPRRRRRAPQKRAGDGPRRRPWGRVWRPLGVHPAFQGPLWATAGGIPNRAALKKVSAAAALAETLAAPARSLLEAGAMPWAAP